MEQSHDQVPIAPAKNRKRKKKNYHRIPWSQYSSFVRIECFHLKEQCWMVFFLCVCFSILQKNLSNSSQVECTYIFLNELTTQLNFFIFSDKNVNHTVISFFVASNIFGIIVICLDRENIPWLTTETNALFNLNRVQNIINPWKCTVRIVDTISLSTKENKRSTIFIE